MVGADLRAARCNQFKGTARPEVGPYRYAKQMRSFSSDNSNGWKSMPFPASYRIGSPPVAHHTKWKLMDSPLSTSTSWPVIERLTAVRK